jgi:hypothetical protein
MMKKLEEKFRRECKKGARIISYQFRLPNTKADKTWELDKGKKKVYFYTIQ